MIQPHWWLLFRFRQIVYTIVKPRLSPGFYYGAAEDTLLEPFDSISDWLLSSPDIDWVMQLRDASRTPFIQQYQL
jgi:hypothetical protein